VKSGETHKYLLYSAMRLGRFGPELMHTVIAADSGAPEDTFGHDARACNGPVSCGLWTADFQYTEEDDGVCMHWKATQVSDWVRLTPTQSAALAEGKPFSEVVAS
jgi:hypothetical protein